jgi:hypothetical protein
VGCDGASARVTAPDEQQRAAATDRAVDTQPDCEPDCDPDAAPAAQCQMSGDGSAASTGRATEDCPSPGARWRSRLVGMAAVVRAYLGLGGDDSGPAGAFDELGAGVYDWQTHDCQSPVGRRLKGFNGGQGVIHLRRPEGSSPGGRGSRCRGGIVIQQAGPSGPSAHRGAPGLSVGRRAQLDAAGDQASNVTTVEAVRRGSRRRPGAVRARYAPGPGSGPSAVGARPSAW